MKEEILYKNKYGVLKEKYKTLDDKYKLLDKKIEHYKKVNLRMTDEKRAMVVKIDQLESEVARK